MTECKIFDKKPPTSSPFVNAVERTNWCYLTVYEPLCLVVSKNNFFSAYTVFASLTCSGTLKIEGYMKALL